MTVTNVLRRRGMPLLRALLPVCLLTMGGGVNLDDVAGLAKLADTAQKALPVGVVDSPASCQRQNSLLNGNPMEESPPSYRCRTADQDVADHLSKDQNLLIFYLDSLGKLASNAPLSYDQGIHTNVTTIGRLPNLSQGTIAASSVAQTIAKILEVLPRVRSQLDH